MKEYLGWTILAVLLMVACPWLAVKFAGSAGMMVCFLLFFAVNPLFSAISGACAGKNIQKLWALPIMTAGMFLVGAWMIFDMGETAFLLYGGCYLLIGVIAMLISGFAKKRRSYH